MNIPITALCAILFAVAPAAQQRSIDSVFAEARVAAEVEHDYPKAEKLYEFIVKASNSRAHQSKAWLQLANLQRRLGKVDEARLALQKAADGEGPAAEEAKQRQAGESLSDGRIMDLISKFRTGAIEQPDLVWYGPSIVKPLIEWVDGESVDLKFVTRAANVLFAIGGEEVFAWIRALPEKASPLKRRAVLRAPIVAAAHLRGRTMLRDALRVFARDPDVSVLKDAITKLGEHVKWSDLLDLIEHEDPDVRDAAWRELGSREDVASIADRRRILDAIRRSNGAWYPEGAMVRRQFVSIDTPAERELYLGALVIPNLVASPKLTVPPDGVNLHVQEVSRIARSFGPVDDTRGGRHTALGFFAKRVMPTWNRDAVPTVLELVELGYDKWIDSFEFFEQHAQPEDWAKLIALHKEAPDGFKNWLSVRKKDMPALHADLFEPLRVYVEDVRVSDTAIARQHREKKRDHDAITRIGSIRNERTTAWLVECMKRALARDPNWVHGEEDAVGVFRAAAYPFFRGRVNDLTREGVGVIARSDELDYASHAIGMLIQAGDSSVVEIVREMYASGNAGRRPLRQALNDLVSGTDDASPELCVTLVRACLDTGSDEAWADIQHAASALGGHMPSTAKSLPEVAEIARIVIARIKSAPDAFRATIVDRLFNLRLEGVDLTGMIRELAGDPAVEVRRHVAAATRHLADPEKELAVLRKLAADADAEVVWRLASSIGREPSEALTELLMPLLEHAHNNVRLAALRSIALGTAKERAGEIALRFKDDANARWTLCDIAQRSLDPKLAPLMVEFLRDTHAREKAQEALDAIRTYHDEKARWSRILSGTGLGTNSAAEALVDQARDGKTLAVRIAAIQSLGTLAVAETLPVLIVFMQDDDPKIAAAAKAAIDKINGAGKVPGTNSPR